MATFGFIGTGNMGGVLPGLAPARLSGGEILLANRSATKAEALAQELDCRAVDNAAVAAGADYIFLGVKPYMVAGLMEKIGPVLAARKDRFVLVSMAAALTIPDLRERGCGDWPLIRIMPNTPSAIGEGVIFYTCDGVTAEEEAAFLENMAGAGRLLPLDDHLMGRQNKPWPVMGPASGPHRGHGGRRRGLRPHPSHGDGVRRPDADRRRAADAGDGPPSRCAEGCGLFPRRRHHPGRPGAGGRRVPQRSDGGGHRRL